MSTTPINLQLEQTPNQKNLDLVTFKEFQKLYAAIHALAGYVNGLDLGGVTSPETGSSQVTVSGILNVTVSGEPVYVS